MIRPRILTYTLLVFSFFNTHAMDLQNTEHTNASAPTATTIDDLLSTSTFSTFTVASTLIETGMIDVSLLSRLQGVQLKSREEFEREEQIRQLQALIDSDADVNECIALYGGITNIPLNICAQKNYHQLIEPLVSRGADVNKVFNQHCPLLKAAISGNNEAVLLLLKHKAEIDKTAEGGNTALLGAAQCGHTSTVQILLDNHANVHTGCGTSENNYCNTALTYAVQNNHLSVVKLLLERGAHKGLIKKNQQTNDKLPFLNALHEAVKKNNREITLLLLKYNADPNAQLAHCLQTPLHYAGYFVSKELIPLLLQYGAEINAKCSIGCTALHYSCLQSENKDIQCIKELVKAGASHFETNNRGVTPLDYFSYIPLSRRDTCKNYYQNRATYLAASALSLEQCRAIFLIAFFFRDTPVIAKIIESLRSTHENELRDMLNNHSIDQDGNTVLIDAVQQKDIELIEVLTRTHLINLNKKNKRGLTALHYALLYNIEGFRWYLLEIKKSMFENCIRTYQAILNGRLETHKDTVRIIRTHTSLTDEQKAKTIQKLANNINSDLSVLNAFRLGLSNSGQLTNSAALTALFILVRKIADFRPDLKNDRELSAFKSKIHCNFKIVSLLVNAGAHISAEIIALAAEINYELARDLLLHKLGIMNAFC